MKRLAHHIALLQRQQYGGGGGAAAAMEPRGCVLSVFREIHFPYCARDCALAFLLPRPSVSHVSARSNMRSVPLRVFSCALSFCGGVCRILRTVAIEFSYVRAIYNVAPGTAGTLRHSRSARGTLKLLKRARCRITVGNDFSVLARESVRESVARRSARAEFASPFGTALLLMRPFGHLSIDNPYCKSP